MSIPKNKKVFKSTIKDGYFNMYTHGKSKNKNFLNLENFIDSFINKKINVKLIKFKKTSFYISERFKQLKNDESKNISISIQIMQSMLQNYSSYICFHTVSNILRDDLFSDIPKVKKEFFLKKTAWFMYTMYEVQGDACGWQYYDDAGIVGNMMHSFKESIEKQYSQKMDEWDIVI